MRKLTEKETRKFQDECSEFRDYKTIDEYIGSSQVSLAYSSRHSFEERQGHGLKRDREGWDTRLKTGFRQTTFPWMSDTSAGKDCSRQMPERGAPKICVALKEGQHAVGDKTSAC